MDGYLGLFAGAFLAATVLPFSSAAVLAMLAGFGGGESVPLCLTASLGNTLVGDPLTFAAGLLIPRISDKDS